MSTVKRAACLNLLSCFVLTFSHKTGSCCLTGTTPDEGVSGVAQQRRRTTAPSAPSTATIDEVFGILLGTFGISSALQEWSADPDRGTASCQIDTEMMVPRQRMPRLSTSQRSALSYMHDKGLFTQEAWSELQLQYIDLVFPPDAAGQRQGSLLSHMLHQHTQ